MVGLYRFKSFLVWFKHSIFRDGFGTATFPFLSITPRRHVYINCSLGHQVPSRSDRVNQAKIKKRAIVMV